MEYTAIDARDEVTLAPAQPPVASVVLLHGLGADGWDFVPIVAERDGHDFISAAITNGAVAYLTAGPIEAATAVRVADTSVALSALGSAARDRLDGHVVGITGSVGKTSLKDLLASVASTTFPTSASVGSFNNELGVPLTLANAPDDTRCTVSTALP